MPKTASTRRSAPRTVKKRIVRRVVRRSTPHLHRSAAPAVVAAPGEKLFPVSVGSAVGPAVFCLTLIVAMVAIAVASTTVVLVRTQVTPSAVEARMAADFEYVP